MKKAIYPIVLTTLLLSGCRQTDHSSTIVSMQTIDRNGFAETVSNTDRLAPYHTVNFFKPQPYKKVLRVYGKDHEGKSGSKLNSYHSNGTNWQYLEAVDGRAHGKYLEWHENGKLKIEGIILDGLADLTENAQKSWLFDDECLVWDDEGNLQAKFFYRLGHLENEALYYFPNGNIQKQIPYTQGIIHGTLEGFDEEGNLLEKITYQEGLKNGPAIRYWAPSSCQYQELYREGQLVNASYFTPSGEVAGEIENGHGHKATFEKENILSLIEYQQGRPEGRVEIFRPDGSLQSDYYLKDGKKNGEEREYYSNQTPQLLITWYNDQIQGMVKTWYQNGNLESQREMNGNQKHGLSFAYYQTGELMLMEEYENDKLMKGSYYKRGESEPTSTIEKGEGIATLFSPEGHFLKKITYERSRPVPK